MTEKSHPNETRGDVWQVPGTNQREKNIKDGRRIDVLNELKANVKKLENLLGILGTGKSSFINTVITALTGRYKPYADIGCGSKHNTTRLHKISCKEYWDHENEEDEALNLPNFIDIIGLDVQLSNQKEEDTVNSQIMRLIINGKLSEDYDLLDLGKKLKEGNERKEGMELVDRSEDESLAIDIIIVVISLEDNNIPHALLEEIYAEANVRTRQIPVFSVLTKRDKCDLSQKGLEKKKKDIAEAMSIAANKILICENYQQNQNPDSRDVEILEFLTKPCDMKLSTPVPSDEELSTFASSDKKLSTSAPSDKELGTPAPSNKKLGTPAPCIKVLSTPAPSIKELGKPALNVKKQGTPAPSDKKLSTSVPSDKELGS
ncbi:uncharacterized protein LOC128182565 isoform X1 [Crassostrea angulata]|uniref:uncharacterized protein LOC128182565 isoform X1 n=1 Tax=Magallana angulata TaxID=2784310 RepID=UPI0022B0EF03|nr:uncharacterized protein LOC128182565 isoform X1 [Crassostrea angulata]